MAFNAVVLAGTDHKQIKRFGQPKSTLQINGKLVVEYVVDALKGASHVDDIVVVGPTGNQHDLEQRLNDQQIRVVREGKGFAENAGLGYEATTKNSDFAFFVMGDIPLATADSIDFILERALKEWKGEFDVYWPWASEQVVSQITSKFPELRKNYFRFIDGSFRTANSALVNVKRFQNRMLVDKSHALRTLDRTATMIRVAISAPYLTLKYFLRRPTFGQFGLTLEDAKKWAYKRFGVKFRFLETVYPETTIDIDATKDYKILKEIIEKDLYKP